MGRAHYRAKGGRWMTSERPRVREAHRPDPSGCRQLESCLRSKDSRAVWRGTGRKGSNDLARGLLYLVPRSRFRQRLRRSVDMTSDVKGWEQLFFICLLFFLFSIGRAGASMTRRLILLLAVGWLPPDGPPSGACLMLGTSVPCGLVTLPRVPPHRCGPSSDRGWKPRTLVCQHAALVRRSGAWAPAWQWPTCRHCSPEQWRRRLDGHLCLWPSAGDTVGRAGPALARGSL